MRRFSIELRRCRMYACFSQITTEHATLGFQHEANLDEGTMWPVLFALKALTAADEARIAALVKKAVSGD